jgi:hypothetical protein
MTSAPETAPFPEDYWQSEREILLEMRAEIASLRAEVGRQGAIWDEVLPDMRRAAAILRKPIFNGARRARG